MKLRILQRHIDKAVEKQATGVFVLPTCCPIWHAVSEKFPNLANVKCYSSRIDADFQPMFNIDEDGQKITKMHYANWETLRPQTITLTRIK